MTALRSKGFAREGEDDVEMVEVNESPKEMKKRGRKAKEGGQAKEEVKSEVAEISVKVIFGKLISRSPNGKASSPPLPPF